MVKRITSMVRPIFVLAISTALFAVVFDLAGAGLELVYQTVPGWIILLELISISVLFGYLASRFSYVPYPWSMLYVSTIPLLWTFSYFVFAFLKDGRIEFEKPQLLITVVLIQVVFIVTGAYIGHAFGKHRKTTTT